ncbi:uncharacterized protein LOC131619561 [Vicia villosa]|uniref:uncharacterized protein LOC131619561 n=1 Tax=Vicia villosa TaxID=3911 RepID=UPI00273BE856|nr:uncharacterized protein LOC131619561 [Vicia villosa]
MNRFSFFVAVFLLCVVNTYAVKVVDVNSICKNVVNPPFCLKFLKLKQGVDLVTLAQYTINVARIKATSIVNLTTTLISQGDIGVVAKAHYEICLEYFGSSGALRELKYAEEYLKGGDYFSLKEQVRYLINDYANCVSTESSSRDEPFDDKTRIPKWAESIKDFAFILISISDFLLKK